MLFEQYDCLSFWVQINFHHTGHESVVQKQAHTFHESINEYCAVQFIQEVFNDHVFKHSWVLQELIISCFNWFEQNESVTIIQSLLEQLIVLVFSHHQHDLLHSHQSDVFQEYVYDIHDVQFHINQLLHLKTHEFVDQVSLYTHSFEGI